MNTSIDRPRNPDLDDKITAMLRQVDAATPVPPAFDELGDTPVTSGAQRPNWVTLGAAASIVALGVGGLVLLGTRDDAPVADRPASPIDGSVPPAAGSEPLDEPAALDPEPLGFGDPLIGAALPADAIPLFEIDQPNWVKQYAYGNDELPLGDTRTTTVVLVGADGPTFDGPFVSLSVFDATGIDIATFGESIDVGGVTAAMTSRPTDSESGLAGPIVNLTVPLADGLALTVNSVRLGTDATVALAETVEATASSIELVAPPGLRQLPTSVPEAWRTFSYLWGFDDGSAVPEPVVISTPTASEELLQQPSIEVIGSNLGAISLAGRIGQEARANRVVNGVDMAVRPMPDSSGTYWVDWLDGDWSFYAIGQNLESEEQFFDLLSSLRLTDADTFASSGGVDLIMPGVQAELVGEILGDSALTTERLEQAAAVAMATSRYNYEFELYLGLGCAASAQWQLADAAGDEAGRAAARAAVEGAFARPDDTAGLPSVVGLDGLADAMGAGDSVVVAEFGSNDCPLWSR